MIGCVYLLKNDCITLRLSQLDYKTQIDPLDGTANVMTKVTPPPTNETRVA
jgi:hypothetical protein